MTVHTTADGPVGALRQLVMDRLGIEEEPGLRLAYAGKTLEDGGKLGDYNVQRESILSVSPALAGGGRSEEDKRAKKKEKKTKAEPREPEDSEADRQWREVVGVISDYFDYLRESNHPCVKEGKMKEWFLLACTARDWEQHEAEGEAAEAIQRSFRARCFRLNLVQALMWKRAEAACRQQRSEEDSNEQRAATVSTPPRRAGRKQAADTPTTAASSCLDTPTSRGTDASWLTAVRCPAWPEAEGTEKGGCGRRGPPAQGGETKGAGLELQAILSRRRDIAEGRGTGQPVPEVSSHF